jgi:hypothetical protein
LLGFLADNSSRVRHSVHRRLRLGFRSGQRHLNSKARKRLLSLQLPLSAPKLLRRCLIPLRRVCMAPGFFMELRKLKRNHRVSRGFIKSRELRRRIFAGSRFSDSSLNVSPVWHGRHSISANLCEPIVTAVFLAAVPPCQAAIIPRMMLPATIGNSRH